jgi:hypothetical protein
MKEVLLILKVVMIMAVTTNLAAQPIAFEEAKPYLGIFEQSVTIPDGYQFHSVKKVKVDNVYAYLFRYEKRENKGSNGEHFSFIVSEKDKQILGFTNMDKKYSNPKMLSKIETEKIAQAFLLKLDESLANNLKNLWIERHDEEISINNGEKTIIAGMKYKCYRSPGNDYAWVIVGFDGSVITFERNIKWNTSEHKRITEKWLHDNWLNEQTI